MVCFICKTFVQLYFYLLFSYALLKGYALVFQFLILEITRLNSSIQSPLNYSVISKFKLHKSQEYMKFLMLTADYRIIKNGKATKLKSEVSNPFW